MTFSFIYLTASSLGMACGIFIAALRLYCGVQTPECAASVVAAPRPTYSAACGILVPLCVHGCRLSCSVVSNSIIRPHELQPARLLCPWDSPGQNTGVGCHAFLQGILPIQRLNLCLLHWQAASLPLNHLGSTVHFSHLSRQSCPR